MALKTELLIKMKDLHEQIEPKEYVVGAGEDPWTMTSQ
jgi:hypothetical protein